MAQYTKYFDNCKAVFQGGGCKAIAYIGAYEEAYNRGVCFSEVAGTSAGSMIAALVAANATPEYLKKLVEKTDFSKFRNGKLSVFFPLLRVVLKYTMKLDWYTAYHLSLCELVRKHGLFSTKPIEKFINAELCKLMGLDGEVRFRDLVRDLHIVSSDLYMHNVKVWSKENTPDESVAKAVCASCAIPGYFQPVDDRYVDGGILCNLPNFVFAENAQYNKILSFRFVPNKDRLLHKTVRDYCDNIVDTVIQGADNLHDLQPIETYDIPISSGDVSATDFAMIKPETIAELIEKGRKATEKFFDNEQYFSYSKVGHITKKMTSIEQVHSLVAYLGNDKHDEVIVSYPDTKWVWMLYPTMIKWCKNRAKITIYYSKNDGHVVSRLRLLKAMDVKFICKDELPCEGFFFCGNNNWRGIVMSHCNDSFHAKYYNESSDAPLLCAMIKENFKDRSDVQTSPVGIKSKSAGEIIKLLKSDPIYKDADMAYECIPFEKLKFMNPFIRALKYKQIDSLYELYKDNNIVPFAAAELTFSGSNKCSVVGPPVIEEMGGEYYVIEGNTRLTYAYRHNMNPLYVVVARNVSTHLPCGKVDRFYGVEEILITDQKIEGVARFGKDWDYASFRHIESVLRPKDEYMKPDNPEDDVKEPETIEI